MTNIDKLREIALAEDLIAEQQAFIIKMSEQQGMPFSPRQTACRSCYQDQAVKLWRVLKTEEGKSDSTRKYLLRAGVDVIWRGRRVNDMLTDKELKAILKAGFPKDYFCRINGEDGSWL